MRMQLNKKKNTQTTNPVYKSLAVATCTLLANTSQTAQAHEVEGRDLDYSTSFMDYIESSRVKVREVDQTIRWQMNDDTVLSGSFIFDSITGATPSGALKPTGGEAQTSTTASGTSLGSGGNLGGGSSGGAVFLEPLSPIVDRRVSFSGLVERSLNRKAKYIVGGLFSSEDDYTSVGANATYAAELNNKLTTISTGLAVSFDLIRPDGGPPPADKRLTNVNTIFSLEDGEKRTIDGNISMTQVLNHRTVSKMTFSHGITQGYLEDPYKVVPLRDDTSGLADAYFHENRPNSRTRSALVFDLNHQPYEEDVIQLQYRYFWDNWDMDSHTLDFRYRYQMGRNYILPHLRLYHQSAANFYTRFLSVDNNENPDGLDSNGDVIDPIGANAPAHASSDTRLDEMNAITLGARFGIEGPLGHFRIRWELIRQKGNDSEFPELKAYFFQVAWTLNLE